MSSVDTHQALRTAVEAALDKKAFNLNALEVGELTSYADVFLICSAGSDRQVTAIADSVTRKLRDVGRKPLHSEGSGRSEWVLLDYGDLLLHIFTEEKRAYYALDSLWGDAPSIDLKDLRENDS